MKKQQFEVEIKTLLGKKGQADQLVTKIRRHSSFRKVGQSRQLNHYFLIGDWVKLLKKIKPKLTKEDFARLENIVKHGKSFSVRTRQADEKILFVLKAAADETTGANGTARFEFEHMMKGMTLKELDQMLLDSGFGYEAKWSREREEYAYKGMIVTVDKNAGYGYLAEFEKVLDDPDKLESAKKEIRKELRGLGIEELSQDRLARMFDFYNKNWPSYYGTDKTFTIK